MSKGGKVVEVRGDPTDPEGKGELTLRGKHIKELLYAPDRLKHPMKRAGEKGEKMPDGKPAPHEGYYHQRR